jgi:hypothetical protein
MAEVSEHDSHSFYTTDRLAGGATPRVVPLPIKFGGEGEN